jgi:hypothetical protein
MKFLPELIRIIYNEFIGIYPDQPRIFPNSVYLQLTTPLNERHVDDPDMVFIHPQSQFYLDVQDDSRSLSLPPFPDNIRFYSHCISRRDDCDDVRPPSGPSQFFSAIYFTSEGNSSNTTIEVLKRLIWVLVCWDDVYAALKPHGVNVADGRTTGMGVLCRRKTNVTV